MEAERSEGTGTGLEGLSNVLKVDQDKVAMVREVVCSVATEDMMHPGSNYLPAFTRGRDENRDSPDRIFQWIHHAGA